MHLYIYYDVPVAAVEPVLRRVRAMQAEVQGVRARLMRRPERRDGVETWMEIYEDVDPAFDDRLAASIERHGLAALTGPRHVERFEDIP